MLPAIEPVLSLSPELFGRAGGPWQSVRNFGMSGFERSGPLKRWVARQAMGLGLRGRAGKTETDLGEAI